ncbi:TetR family transcriptional regulator [Actinomadura barringtoniae]|uniref:TetR family transcriptional regulator n=1 Tax=Actinomadura barringtoniae TaxID=1427535 RepID=A0A939TA50_9ACTN|nr:TetR/AcrR family transcriptional regulator [Actinomadura barringtoniae]MBO2455768.1 TetR family transcriptional regulator [Actinomadura barringtoniae]
MSPVKSRREQYSEATKAALLEAATRRFAERGFAGTSLEDVASDIQATRGAVYHHFANKTALFEAVFDALEVETIRLSMEAAANQEDPWEAGQAALSSFLDVCCDPVYGRIVWQEAPLALGWERWKECEQKYALGLIEGIIKSLVDSGDLPELLPLEATARITFHILGAAGMALSETPEPDKPRVREEYGRSITYLLTNARVQAAG